jgi:L-aspartate oxidase
VNVRGDFLVIGSGIAGLRAALALADAGDVILLTKADPRESATGYAQGGIAAALGPDDSPALHARDTVAAGDGLCVPEAVDALVQEGPRYVRELIEWGAAFDRDANGRIALAREGAHSVRRVLHAHDATGREIARLLWSRVAAEPRIRVVDDGLATDLQVKDGRCVGAQFLAAGGEEGAASAPHTLLATGGAGQVFRETTNPTIATGDGIAMAARAGVPLVDLEFVQFHPTVLSVQGAPRFLLSEALRGEGAQLVNHQGESFMHRYEPAGDLASRDLVSRAMVREAARTAAPVYLTLAHLDAAFVRRRFPTIADACGRAGLDLTRDRIPVSPAAHYLMGGIETDLDGRTSLEGLFAAGEVACTGVHGANRLASNSLLEGLVFGARAARAMRDGDGGAAALPPVDLQESVLPSANPGSMPSADEVRNLMWDAGGVLRTGPALERAVERLDAWVGAAQAAWRLAPRDREVRRVSSIATVGWLIVRAALRRVESRGAHFRTDFPVRDDLHWKIRIADRLHVD